MRLVKKLLLYLGVMIVIFALGATQISASDQTVSQSIGIDVSYTQLPVVDPPGQEIDKIPPLNAGGGNGTVQTGDELSIMFSIINILITSIILLVLIILKKNKDNLLCDDLSDESLINHAII